MSRQRSRKQENKSHPVDVDRLSDPGLDDDIPLYDHEPIVRIAPYHYVHILNLNTNVTNLVVGPKTYVCLEHERVVLGPEKMVTISSGQYCVVMNPVTRDAKGNTVVDPHGQARLRIGDDEYRFTQEPFALYPGESLKGKIEPLPVVLVNHALRLSAQVNFVDADGVNRVAGEEWLFEGPGIYYPRKEAVIVAKAKALMIKPNTALRLRAQKDCVDREGNPRFYGEEWLVKKPGVYLPGAYEEFVKFEKAYTLTDRIALHVKALRTFVDDYGKKRKLGDEWLITLKDTESHICSVNEEVVSTVDVTILGSQDYCTILDPVDENGVQQLGTRRLVRGEKSFFLQPGERLETGVRSTYMLGNEEGLILMAREQFVDEIEVIKKDVEAAPSVVKILRQPGDRWLLRGPIEYVPPVCVKVMEHRDLIPLDRNEGIYVRNMKTGQVRAVIGEAYMLNQDEELWEKKLPNVVIELLTRDLDPLADRASREGKRKSNSIDQDCFDSTRVVSFQVPHNAAVQVYDYKNKRARVEFGPDLVLLGPDEQFTLLSLSGGKPKRPNMIKSLCLLLGPDFCTDIIVVVTADHARLSLQLSYNWLFDTSKVSDPAEASKLFSVPDFIGDACKAIASRIRGTVASVQFDDFHKHSSRIIRSSVFGLDENKKVRDRFLFPQNNLHITSIDVQSVEPVDQRTRDALQKSVQLAIEITTNSQEAAARHQAERLEQEAQGLLERQKIEDEAAAEKSRRNLVELRVQSAALETTGQAKAEALGRAEAAQIEGEATVAQARLRAQAMAIETEAELDKLQKAREAELTYLSEKSKLDLRVRAEQVELDVSRFTSMVSTLGADTLRSIAVAGPEQDIRMLKALGLQSTLITDGTNPINLLATAHGLIGSMMSGGSVGAQPGSKSVRAVQHLSAPEGHTVVQPESDDGDDDGDESTMS